MSRAIGDLLSTLSLFVPLRVLLVAGLVVLVLALPSWLESVREKQVRGLVRRLVRASPDDREALERSILALAGTRPGRLRAMVESAVRYDQRGLRDRGIALLEQAGAVQDARKIREAVTPKKARFRDPVEAALRIEAYLSEGRTVAAAEALAEALESFPLDEELRALERAVAERSSPQP